MKMCDQCVKNLQELFPDETEESCINILWGLTCFPFGNAQDVEVQLRHVAEIGIENAYTELDQEMKRLMSEINQEKEV
jgi:hypothetical protein